MANDFNQTVGSLFQGMDSLLTTKTVVGEPTKVGDTIILPLVDVNFGVAAGAFGKTAVPTLLEAEWAVRCLQLRYL